MLMDSRTASVTVRPVEADTAPSVAVSVADPSACVERNPSCPDVALNVATFVSADDHVT